VAQILKIVHSGWFCFIPFKCDGTLKIFDWRLHRGRGGMWGGGGGAASPSPPGKGSGDLVIH